MTAHTKTGLITMLIVMTGAFVLTEKLFAGLATFPQTQATVASKHAKDLIITITSANGRLKAGENGFCVTFQKRETEEPVEVRNAGVQFTLLVGKIQEDPIRAEITGDGKGRYCGHVGLGKQYYVPASYYVFVRYVDAVGNKRKERLFLSIK